MDNLKKSSSEKYQSQTWKDLVAKALKDLGGQAHLSQINEQLIDHPKTVSNPTWKDTIRRVVRQYRIFQPVPPERSGVYQLVDIAETIPELDSLDSQNPEINHGVAQGMLVVLGNIFGYETYVPPHDQSTRSFQDNKLSDLITVSDCNDIFQGPNLSKVREIDVLWFSEDDYGLFPAYAFEVEHSTRVKNGLDRLLKIPARFPTRFFVIGPDIEEENLFNRYIIQTPYRKYQNRFLFKKYEVLQGIYNAAVNFDEEQSRFGIDIREKV